MVGTVLCGVATSFPFITAARAVAGIGGAGMTVVAQILIGDFFGTGAENRGKQAQWRGIGNVVVTTGRAIGGPLGGFLSDTVGWRWGFTGQGPLIGLLFVAIAVYLKDPSLKPEDLGPVVGRGSVADAAKKSNKLRRIDVPGALLITSSVILLVFGIDLPGQGVSWSSASVWGSFLGAGTLLSLFLLYEGRYAKEPIYPPRLLKQRNIITSYLCLFFGVASQVSMLYTVPLYFQVTAGASAGNAGLHIVPSVLASSVGGLMAAWYVRRTNRYKNMIILASICTSIGYIIMIFTWGEESVGWGKTMAIVPAGFGTGIIMSSSYIGMTARLKRADMAVGTSGLLLFQNIGVVFGISIAGSILNTALRELLAESLSGPDASSILDGVLSDIGYLDVLDDEAKKIVISAYVAGIDRSHMFSLACSTAAFLVALVIPETRRT